MKKLVIAICIIFTFLLGCNEPKQQTLTEREKGLSPHFAYSDSSIQVNAEKGDGLIHVARKAIAIYLIEKQKTLQKDKVVYSEHALANSYKRLYGEVMDKVRIEPGDEYYFKVADIETAIAKADHITPNQLRTYTKKVNWKPYPFFTND